MHHTRLFPALLILLGMAASAHAIGAGAVLSAQPELHFTGDAVQAAVPFRALGTLRFTHVVTDFGLAFLPQQDKVLAGVTGTLDYLFLDTQIHNTWSFYAGAGIQADALYDFWSDFYLDGGIRLLAGVSVTFLDNYLELFFQQAAVPAVSLSTAGSPAFLLILPFEAGLRVHF